MKSEKKKNNVDKMKYKINAHKGLRSWLLCKPFAIWSVLEHNSFSINMEILVGLILFQIHTYAFSSFFFSFCNSVEWHHLVAAMFISTAYNFLDDSAFILAVSGFACALIGYLYKVIT